ncbi:MAG: PTS system fructose subfamily IIA component [Desulfuromonadaceae bacterium]|nr:PTS system fructose subfamily IIA component [Desulfuromonadaceae bacterium]
MIGIVVVAHSRLAQELIATAEMIIGSAPLLAAVSIDREVSVDAAQEELRQVLGIVGSDGDGVIILTDMFGGTPTNISAEFLQSQKVEILTGVSLPMLLKSVSARHGENLEGLAVLLKEYAKNAIMRPAEMLKGVG